MNNAIIVSADPELRRLVRESVDGLPLKVVGDCANLKAAMELFRETAIQMVFVDLFQRDSSGLDVIKSLKKIDDTLVCILLSRVQGRGLKDRAFRFGANDIVEYPVDREVLRQTVQHRLAGLADANMIVFQTT